MAKPEEFGWYKRVPKLFIRGVRGLGPDLIGAYAVILDLIYEDEESCPNDPAWLGGIMGCSPRKARALIDSLVKRGKLHFNEAGRLVNDKALEVIEERHISKKKAAEKGETGGKRSAEVRAETKIAKDLAEAEVKRLEKIREEEEERKKKAQAPSLPGLEFPEWWPTEAWRGYLEMRKKLRKPPTDRAVQMVVAEVTRLRAGGHDPAAVLDQSTRKCWTDVYAVKGADTGPGGLFAAAPPVADTKLWAWRLETFHHGQPETDEEQAIRAGYWRPDWGPEPGKAGCLVPAEAIEAYRRRRPPAAAVGAG